MSELEQKFDTCESTYNGVRCCRQRNHALYESDEDHYDEKGEFYWEATKQELEQFRKLKEDKSKEIDLKLALFSKELNEIMNEFEKYHFSGREMIKILEKHLPNDWLPSNICW